MIRIGPILVIGGIIASMGIALYYYDLYKPIIFDVNAGEPVNVGPVRYMIEYEGTHDGDEETRPEDTFVKIRIRATNLGEIETRMSGGQFRIVDENDTQTWPTFGNFSGEDLLYHYLEPERESVWTTQFDIPFDEKKQYVIKILPTKEQESKDVGMVCVINC